MTTSSRGTRGMKRVLTTCLTTLVALLVLPAMASAATRLVSPTGTDAGDCTGTPCLHIQYAVNQAVANDTISIAAGTYATEPGNQVLVNKGLTITGAGIGQTILDGNSAHNLSNNGGVGAGTLSIITATADPVTVSGLTVREPGATAAAHGADAHYAIFAKGTVPAGNATYTFSAIRVEGNGAGGLDNNFYAVGSNANLVIQNSQFVEADGNAILLERSQGTADVNGNTITRATGGRVGSPYFDANYAGGTPGNPTGTAGLHRFRNNTVDARGNGGAAFDAAWSFGNPASGGYSGIEVTGNTITNLGATSTAIALDNDTTDATGASGLIGAATITGNSVTGPGGTGVRLRGLINGITISSNQITGLTRGIQLAQSTGGAHAPAASDVHFNRLVNNATAQLERLAGGAVNAENNWWGCNEGPNNAGCGTVTGANVDFDPWLVLTLSASPTSIEIGGNTSTITADLRRNSNGAQVGTAHRDGFPVDYATNLGSVSPDPGSVTSGVSTTTLTSGATAGTANVTATVDNETASTPVQITDTGIPETAITSGPTNGVTIQNNTATFTFNSPNEPNATFQCRVDSADPAAFQACTSPYTTPPLADGPHVFEVRAVDPNNNVDPSPARVTFVVNTQPGGGVAGEVARKVKGACDNRILGTNQPDDLNGTGEGDRIFGYGADDVLKGRTNFDCLKGHKGDDTLLPGLAADVVQGGPGNDLSNSRDGKRDKINCGPGDDAALVDQRDVVKNCERIVVKVQLKV